MFKGRIVLVPFPFTDLSGQKVRPALILYAGRSEDCIVAFISSARRKQGRFTVPIRATSGNGLKTDSVIRLDKLATLQKKVVLGELGRVEREMLVGVDTALRKLLKL